MQENTLKADVETDLVDDYYIRWFQILSCLRENKFITPDTSLKSSLTIQRTKDAFCTLVMRWWWHLRERMKRMVL